MWSKMVVIFQLSIITLARFSNFWQNQNELEKPQKQYRVIENYQSPYPEPIIFHKGELVTVGKEFTDDPDWMNWVWCEGRNNNQAWVPKQYLDIEANQGVFNTDYNALELSVVVGEVLIIYEIVNGFGLAEKQTGERGWVPLRNTEPSDI